MANEALFGALPAGWTYATLGEVCEQGGGGIQTGPFGSQLHKADYVPVGIPSIMPQNIGENRVVEDGIARITIDDARRLSRYLVRPGDIVYSRRGDVEKRALIREAEDGWLCGTGCLRVRLGERGPNPNYTSFYLGHPLVREWIVRHAHGATMPNLNTSILSACPFVLPPKAEQDGIASILNALDDKIDLNRCMNETLEQTARTIFKDWFVDFGPTRAKMAGQEAYLSEDLWALFPEQLDEAGVPEGWSLFSLSEIFDVAIGRTPPRKEQEHFAPGGKGRTWLSIKTMGGLQTYAFDSDEDLTSEAVARFRVPHIPAGTVLVSFKLTVGRVAIAAKDMHSNEAIASLVRNEETPVSDEFAYLFMKGFDYSSLGSTSSIATAVNSQSIKQVKMLVPETQVHQTFTATVQPFFQQIKRNNLEAQALTQTRDLLLLKLMSGELRVWDAEAQVAEVL